MAIKPYLVQRRMMELGRVRLGEKGPKGEPKKLATLRFTSASKPYLDAIASLHGGTVRDWDGAPEEGMFEVTTDATRIDIILPPVFSDQDGTPTAPYSQYFETWSAAGCTCRCDGETEALSGKPCMCAAAVEKNGEDARTCKITTRVSFMIPDVPGLGVWRLESHGWNAAVELPGTLEVLLLAAAAQKFIPAVLRVEPRTKKVPGEPTRRFIVPVIELPGVTVRQLAAGDVPLAINAPQPRTGRPELPAAPAPPVDARFEEGVQPGFGAPPPLPSGPEPQAAAADATVSAAPAAPPSADDEAGQGERPSSPAATTAQKKKLNVLVGQLRDQEHITTEQLWRATGRNPVISDDGELHWSPLRDALSKDEANRLIDRLETYQSNLAAV